MCAQSAAPDLAPPVLVEACPPELTAALPAVIKLELDVLRRERGATRASPDRIAVRCNDDRARIEVTMAGSSRESSLDLSALATTEPRARAVALAAAELVHAIANQTAAEPAPVRQTPERGPALTRPAPLTPLIEPSPQRSSRRPALLAGGLAEWLGKPGAVLLGARLGLHYPLGDVVVPALSIDGATGEFSTRSARIVVTTLAAGAHVYFGVTTGRLRWDAGPGARLGWVRLAGRPDAGATYEGQTLQAAWGGPEVRARVLYGVAERGSPLLALEAAAGIVTLPVAGLLDQRDTVYAVDGPWLSLCAEFGLSL